MNRFGNLLKPLMWFAALLLAALMAGCGAAGGDGGTDPGLPTAAGAGSGVGGLGRGPGPVDLKTAGNFVILAEDAITDVSPSTVFGDVGLTPAIGTLIDLTCAEVVTGVIYTVPGAGPPCRVQNDALLTRAKNDGIAAFFDARNRVPDYVDLDAGNIGGRNLGPATYNWNTPVVIPSDLTLTGGPNDVWIFQIWQSDPNAISLSVGSGVQIILAGGALPQNVYWEIGAADLGSSSQFKGVIIADFSIVMRTGASIDGRVLAGSAANLDKNTVTEPIP